MWSGCVIPGREITLFLLERVQIISVKVFRINLLPLTPIRSFIFLMNNTVLNNIAHFVGKMVIIFSATILVKYLLNVYSIQLTDFYYLKIICFLGLIISFISALDYLIKLILLQSPKA